MTVDSLAVCSTSDDSGQFAVHQMTVDSLAVCSTLDDSGQFDNMQYIR